MLLTDTTVENHVEMHMLRRQAKLSMHLLPLLILYLVFPAAVICASAASSGFNPPAALAYFILHSAMAIPYVIYLLLLRLHVRLDACSVVNVCAVTAYSLIASAMVAGVLCLLLHNKSSITYLSLYAHLWLLYGASWIVGPIAGMMLLSVRKWLSDRTSA